MVDLEVRELRYFTAVAEELNFTRAADRLGIAQPPLSRAIRQLERRLGVQLFERTSRGVVLTESGLTLLREAGPALEAIAAAVRRTRRAAQVMPALVVTAKPGAATGLLRRIVESHTLVAGTPTVEILVSGFGEQAVMVRDGRADLALLSIPYDERGLDGEPLISEPRVAALPADHQLVERPDLRCADLADWPIPQWPGASPEERAYWTGSHHGSPARGPAVHDTSQLLDVVGLGQAVALVPASLAERNPRPDIAYRPVVDASPYTLALVWRYGDRTRATALFVRHAMDMTAARPTGPPAVPVGAV